VFTFHHLHQKDLIELGEVKRVQRESLMLSLSLPKSLPRTCVDRSSQRPTIFRDSFTTVILPDLGNDTRTNWDNFASRYTLSANATASFHSEFRPANSTALANAFKSLVTRQAACLSFDECLSWRHESGTTTCSLNNAIKLSRELDPPPKWALKTEVASGWILEWMDERLLTKTCGIVKQPWTPRRKH
jgi:hypothetical protein